MNLKKINISFVHHENGPPAMEGQYDLRRPLTEQGARQAIALASKIGHEFKITVSSPARRTRQVALIVGGSEATGYVLESLLTLPDLKGRAILERMYTELGHVPYAQYMLHADFETLLRFAKNAAQKITELLQLKCTSPDVLIVCHGVLMNAIVSEMFPTSDIQQLMRQTQLGECGAIRVKVDGEGFMSVEIFN